MSRLFLFAVLLLAGIAIASDVVVLTEANFDETINSNEHVFVEFFAPWCGHCKTLAPIYEEVATELKGRIIIASVDGTENQGLMTRFGISGFPTLKFFVNGNAIDYNAGRTKKDIIGWIDKKIAPVVLIKSADELAKFVDGVKAAVAFVSSESSEEYNQFKQVALTFDSYKFGVVVSDEVRGSNQLNSVKLYRQFDEVLTSTEINSIALSGWIAEFGFPLVDEFNTESFQRTQAKFNVIVFAIFDVASSTESRKELTDLLTTLSKEYNSKGIGFMVSDTKALRADALGASGKFLPTLVAYNTKKTAGLKIPDMFAWHEPNPINAESARAWVEQILDGTVTAFRKSQPIPESNNGPVKVLVAKNFDEIVKGKNALIEFYAPWCGHCKKLEPIYEELGKAFEGVNDLVIAKMDTTENWTDYQVQGFPTIVLYKKNGTKVKYEGADREFDSLAKFLDKELGVKPKSKDGHAHASHDEL